jgi:hypothetical protein
LYPVQRVGQQRFRPVGPLKNDRYLGATTVQDGRKRLSTSALGALRVRRQFGAENVHDGFSHLDPDG